MSRTLEVTTRVISYGHGWARGYDRALAISRERPAAISGHQTVSTGLQCRNCQIPGSVTQSEVIRINVLMNLGRWHRDNESHCPR